MNERAVAIVGASCRFPGAAGLEAFWRLLIDGVDAVTEIGPDRWSTRFFYHPHRGEPGKSYSWAAGLIDGIDLFEPGFFGISPREAAEMDPQQRLLLELAWHALEDAGIPAADLAGSATGVYIGASSTDYGNLRLGDPAGAGPHFASGMSLGILANRLSHFFDLRGPTQVIDTACSSSLVALHEACEALRAGRIETALVGGVNLLLSPYPFIGFAQAGMLSPRGRCFAFDARADGYVRGEGGAVVVLKPLARALAEGDPIRAVIYATGVGASGRTVGLSLPSAPAQAGLLRGVYGDAGIDAEALAFVEMHGTGTPAGDPAEAEAVGGFLGQARQAPLPIGSVKTNIGHLEPASGIASLLKAMLALEHGVLPRSLYGEMPNPAIPFTHLNLRLVGTAEPIAVDGYAGINSFGFGGSIAHAILAPPPRQEELKVEEVAYPPLMISARSEASLRALAQSWRETIAATPPARRPAMARAAARRRDHHLHRLVMLGDDPASYLDDFLVDRPNPAVVSGAATPGNKLAFVYSGNGAQFLGMGQTAYLACGAFRQAIAETDRALRPHLGWSVEQRVAGEVTDEELRRADIAQPMLFAIQVAITCVLRDLGAAPGGFVGHSVGEIAAAWAGGALPLAVAARIVVTRSRHQERTRGAGRMAALALGPGEAAALLRELGGPLEIGAINSARSVTIAGPGDAIGRLGEIAASRGIARRPLALDFAFHSAAMELIRDDLIAELGDIDSVSPVGDLISTVTGGRIAEGALDASHWWRNVRDPVRFSDAIETLLADGYRLFTEIGPNPVLASYLRDALHAAAPIGKAVASLERRDPPGDPFPAIAARLHAAGYDMSRGAWLDGPCDPRGLPLYPWQREHFWFGKTIEVVELTNPVCGHKLLGFRQAGADMSWVNHLDTVLFPFLGDHRVDGIPVLPGAAIIEMALAAARVQHPDATALELRDVELLRPVGFDHGMREIRTTLLPDGSWQLAGRKRLADEPTILHATTRLGAASASGPARRGTGDRGHKIVSGEMLYRRASRLGLDYGEAFRTLEEVLIDGDRAVAKLQATSVLQGWLIDPFALDGAFQALLALVDDDASEEAAFLPRRFGRIAAVAPFGRAAIRAELRLVRRGERSAAADIVLFDAAGDVVAELTECWFVRTSLHPADTESYLRTELVPAPLARSAPSAFDDLGETLNRVATARQRDQMRERDQALLFEALLATIARETADAAQPEALSALKRRFAGEELPESGELWRSLLADHPEMVAELTLAAILRDAQPVDAVLPTIAALRRTSPSAAAGSTVIAAALDEIAQRWRLDHPLRIHEPGPVRLSDRIRRAGIAVVSVDAGDPCDLALFIEAGLLDVSRVNLAPGGALMAVMPRPNPLWELIGGIPDWRNELAAAGFDDIAATMVSEGPWPNEVIWARAPAQPALQSSVASLSLALIGERENADFVAALETRGHRLTAAEAANDGIIFVAGNDGLNAVSDLIPKFARLAALAAERRVPLWLMTAGAHQAEHANLCHAALWGFGRVSRNETPGLALRLIDLPAGMPCVERAQHLAEELVAGDSESEVVWTRRGRHALRLRRGLPPIWAKPDDAVVASVSPPGRLDRLEWALARLPRPGRGEIVIEVRAVGLNFRDVMVAAGALPEEALLDGFAGAALGLECAGVVCAIGDGVTNVTIGDRVMGFAPAALASRVITRADAMVAIPGDLDSAAAATLPIAFVTARYSLLTLAHLSPGETVLIHAASGGVGLAAIQVAKARGATVIATAGSPAKRAFLRMVGADHVFDSRELRFAAAVREATGGSGVDVVLNSLSGEAIEASLELLKPFGRFVELGKRDFYANRKFTARPLRQNISYFAVDVDQLPARRPELAKALLAEVAAALAAGEIRPLAHRCFAFAELADAFRLMQAAQHIGKLVLVPDGNAGIAVSRKPELLLRRDGGYVVTGGFDGFGFAAARWLAEHGAGHLVLIGRRGLDTPGASRRIAELEALGAKVVACAADVADSQALSDVLDAIRRQGVPIRGVVHAAATIVDGTAAALTAGDVDAAMRAKVSGALNLDQLTRDDPLDFFWLFSSATTAIGAPGQGAYVGANAALEALARRRHGRGKPALAIAWGPIADAGTLAARPDERAALSRRLGVRPMSATRALAALPAMAASGLPVVAFADLATLEPDRALPIVAERLFDDLREVGASTVADKVSLDRLASLGVAERREFLTSAVANAAARILRLPEDSPDPNRPLAELGMDSLMAIELRLALEARLRLDVPLMSFTNGATAAAIAARLAEMIDQPAASATVAEFVRRYEAPPATSEAGATDLAADD